MNKHTDTDSIQKWIFTEDAPGLMAAAADAVREKFGKARKHLAAAFDRSGKTLGHVKEKAIVGAKFADETVRANVYTSMAIALGVGALIGFLTACHRSRKSD